MYLEGMVRKIDNLGRVVIPKELRRKLNINEGDSVTIIDQKNIVIIKKYSKCCIFCGGEEELQEYKGICSCRKCADELNNKAVFIEEKVYKDNDIV